MAMSRPRTTTGDPIAIPRTATTALPRGTIRVPSTVGRKWSSVPTTVSDTNPTRFVHACAGLSSAQRSRTGIQPATISVPRLAPMATLTSASVYACVTIGRRTMSPARPAPLSASAVSAIPARYTVPPIGGRAVHAGTRPRIATRPAPRATSATAPARRRASAGCPAESAATKNGITPAIAVEAPPASARWSGSQGEIVEPGADAARTATAAAAR